MSGKDQSGSGDPLVCPRCALRYPLSERFCPRCEMPLVYAGRADEAPITETHERRRKVRPQYTRGEPVKVGFARNQAEGELLQGLLLEEGIPSLLRRSGGFDVPDFLAAGPRDVLVPESGAEAARRLLSSGLEEEAGSDSGAGPAGPGGVASGSADRRAAGAAGAGAGNQDGGMASGSAGRPGAGAGNQDAGMAGESAGRPAAGEARIGPSPARLAAWLLIALIAAALLVAVLYRLS
ncbi:MAG: hypothetical protein U0R52_00320 [Solirubrobacterales bacterium]